MKKLKINFLVLSFIIILIFLGILWLINKKSNKEGLAPSIIDPATGSAPVSPDIPALSAGIQGAVNAQLEGAGIQTLNPSDFPDIMDQLQGIITNENDANAAATAAREADAAALTTAVDTTQPSFNNNTYFQGDKFGDAFCSIHGSDTQTLNNQCSTLTAESCNQTDCCIFIDGEKCVAGDKDGPKITVDSNGKDIDYAYYSYKNMCYGSCGKDINNAANPCSPYAASDINVSSACLNRLWAQTKCPNTKYMSAAVVERLAPLSKGEIQEKLKDIHSEPNYAKCYGPNPANWPPPCYETTDTSSGLSARCMTKLFTDPGCTNTAYITSKFVEDNNLSPKSDLVADFALIQAGTDDDSLTKCYGSDQNDWPDPCLDAKGNPLSNSAKLWTKEMPVRCTRKLWKGAFGTPQADYVDYWQANPEKRPPDWEFGGYYAWMLEEKKEMDKKSIGVVRGMNPNNWPGVTPIFPDPCSVINGTTKVGELSPNCIKRITQNLPANNIVTPSAMSSILTTESNKALALYDFAAFISKKPPPPPRTKIVGVNTYGKIYTKETLYAPWVFGGNQGVFQSICQLQDGTFLAVGKGDNNLYALQTIASPKVLIQGAGGITNIRQISNGTYLAIDTKGYIRTTETIIAPPSSTTGSLTGLWSPSMCPCITPSVYQEQMAILMGIINAQNAQNNSFWKFLPEGSELNNGKSIKGVAEVKGGYGGYVIAWENNCVFWLSSLDGVPQWFNSSNSDEGCNNIRMKNLVQQLDGTWLCLAVQDRDSDKFNTPHMEGLMFKMNSLQDTTYDMPTPQRYQVNPDIPPLDAKCECGDDADNFNHMVDIGIYG